MTEEEIRTDERKRIAAHMKTIANATLRDPTSDAIDGYSCAVLLDMAEVIEKFPEDRK
jgi:hypothetical protein